MSKVMPAVNIHWIKSADEDFLKHCGKCGRTSEFRISLRGNGWYSLCCRDPECLVKTIEAFV